MKMLLVGAAVVIIGLPNLGFAATEAEKAAAALRQAAVVGAELSTIAKHLQTRPRRQSTFRASAASTASTLVSAMADT